MSTSSGGGRRPQIDCVTLGPWETNCYVVRAPTSSACWIVDAGFEPAALIRHVRDQGLEPEKLILTHAHLDHIAGAREVVEAFGGLPISIHEAERDWLSDPTLNLSAFVEMNITAPEATDLLEDGQPLTLDGHQWIVLHTPGHSPGGVTLVHNDSRQAIVGDTLFQGSIGRFDFPTSDGDTLIRSIRERLMTLPDDTRVLPGHGPETTIGQERDSNPYVRGGLQPFGSTGW
ncbi:MAG: MBL fold metallo-hydrolase [Phycisphaerales bacterium]